MKKREIFMLSSITFSLGIVLGFLISPIKQGISIYGGDTTNNNYAKKNSTTEETL
jgi:hypothetical protein